MTTGPQAGRQAGPFDTGNTDLPWSLTERDGIAADPAAGIFPRAHAGFLLDGLGVPAMPAHVFDAIVAPAPPPRAVTRSTSTTTAMALPAAYSRLQAEEPAHAELIRLRYVERRTERDLAAEWGKRSHVTVGRRVRQARATLSIWTGLAEREIETALREGQHLAISDQGKSMV